MQQHPNEFSKTATGTICITITITWWPCPYNPFGVIFEVNSFMFDIFCLKMPQHYNQVNNNVINILGIILPALWKNHKDFLIISQKKEINLTNMIQNLPNQRLIKVGSSSPGSVNKNPSFDCLSALTVAIQQIKHARSSPRTWPVVFYPFLSSPWLLLFLLVLERSDWTVHLWCRYNFNDIYIKSINERVMSW